MIRLAEAYFSSYLPFLPTIRTSINTFYPGMKFAITEYNFGGEGHISEHLHPRPRGRW